MHNQTSTIKIPFTLEQIVLALQQLSPKKLEELDLMLDKKMEKSVLERGKIAWQEYKNGKTLTLNQLKQEFLK